MVMCRIGPEYLSADAAAFNPSHMLAAEHLLVVGGSLDVVVCAAHRFAILLLFYLFAYFGDLLRHVSGYSDSPHPAVGSGVESYGLVADLEIYAQPQNLPAFILEIPPSVLDLLRR